MQRASRRARALPAWARHSLWLFWNDDASVAHWYVNFERPLLRTRLGSDVQDEKLDLVVDPSGAVRWKGEDELEEAAAHVSSTRRA